MKWTLNIRITWSKIMSLLILAAGTTVAILLSSSTVMEITLLSVLAVLGVKQVSDIWKPQTPPQNGNTGPGPAPKEVDKKDME